MTIDILYNTYKNTLDAVFLISGDGDYIPVIQEVMGHGKKVYVGALSSGLSQRLRIVPDRFFPLDSYFFKSVKLFRALTARFWGALSPRSWERVRAALIDNSNTCAISCGCRFRGYSPSFRFRGKRHSTILSGFSSSSTTAFACKVVENKEP
jgi:hypothetical protein